MLVLNVKANEIEIYAEWCKINLHPGCQLLVAFSDVILSSVTFVIDIIFYCLFLGPVVPVPG